MEMDKKNLNMQIGKRLRESRKNMNIGKAEIARILDVGEEHYRKLEAGHTGLSVDKMLVLYEKYGIDPTYLITGKCSDPAGFNLDYFVANSSREQRDQFFEHVLTYVIRLIRK